MMGDDGRRRKTSENIGKQRETAGDGWGRRDHRERQRTTVGGGGQHDVVSPVPGPGWTDYPVVNTGNNIAECW